VRLARRLEISVESASASSEESDSGSDVSTVSSEGVRLCDFVGLEEDEEGREGGVEEVEVEVER
jgi:hypothetical protein